MKNEHRRGQVADLTEEERREALENWPWDDMDEEPYN